MKSIFGIFLLLTFVRAAVGQDQTSSKVYLVGRAEQNAIVLRIAPGSPALWELGNKYGYIVERFTVTRDKQYLGSREREVLTPTPLKPLPMAEWETMSLNNPYAEIAVEAIYGETFEVSSNFGQDIMEMYNKAKELESRFSFALFSADISQEVSQASGLYLKDTDVRKNEKYLYRVYSAVPQNLIKSDTGFVYLGLTDYAPLPEIRDVKAQFSDHLAMVSWSTRYAQSFYSAYWIERSEDGKVFQRASEIPYVNTFAEDKADPGAETVNKADQRKAAADKRASLAPLKKKINEIESLTAKLEKQIQALDAELADPVLYEKHPAKAAAKGVWDKITASATELKNKVAAWRPSMPSSDLLSAMRPAHPPSPDTGPGRPSAAGAHRTPRRPDTRQTPCSR